MTCKPLVIITVNGGVAYLELNSSDAEVFIIDYDNLPDDYNCQICGTKLEDIHDYSEEDGYIILSMHYCPACDKDWEVKDPVDYLKEKYKVSK